jgi:uncharacterized membrane protein YbhN (UPF0104 family)
VVPVLLTDAVDASVIFATVVVFFVTGQWTASSPWWSDPIGSTVVVKDLALLVILIPSCVSIVWPGVVSPFEAAVIALASMLGISFALTWRAVVMWRIRKPWPFRRRDSGTDKTL